MNTPGLSTIFFAIGTTLLLSSCAQPVFMDAYDFRNKAASDVGLQDGSPTVWNEDTPLQLGRIYQLYGNRKNGYDLTSYSGLYTTSVADKSVSTIGPDNSTWSADISDSNKVDLQLGYMGLQAVADINAVKKISFSLEGDTKGTVMEYDKLQDILNDPNNGPTLRASILEDTHRVFDQKLSRQAARFWIVLQVHTAKNLTVTLHTDSGFSGKLDTSDAAQACELDQGPKSRLPHGQRGTGPSKGCDLQGGRLLRLGRDVRPLVRLHHRPVQGPNLSRRNHGTLGGQYAAPLIQQIRPRFPARPCPIGFSPTHRSSAGKDAGW